MEALKWYIPFQKVSKNLNTFLKDFSEVFSKSLGYQVHSEAYNNTEPLIKQIAKSPNAIALVSNYEATYLESFYEFHPFFKFSFSDINGLIAVHKDSDFNRLTDLNKEKVILPQATDWFYLNPVILYLIKNSTIVNLTDKQKLLLRPEVISLRSVINKTVSAAVSRTFDYNVFPEKEQKRLRIIGKFPLIPEFIGVAGSDLDAKSLKKSKPGMAKWVLKNYDAMSKIGLRFTAIEKLNSLIFIEAIEGLGYTLKGFIEEYSNPLLDSITVNSSSELKHLREKHDRLTMFNEKLAKMYREIRESRDSLSKIIDSSSDQVILFLRDGNILGVSRAFSNFLKYNRQDVIGKEISNFIETSVNTPLKTLIKQIDCGLLRSFFVKLKKSDVTEEKAKMEFCIIELLDSKVILGTVTKKK